MPTLFADDPTAMENVLRAEPDNLRKDIERLNRAFFIPESVHLDEADAIVRKPRLGDVDFIFKNRNLDRLFEAPVIRASAYTEGTKMFHQKTIGHWL